MLELEAIMNMKQFVELCTVTKGVVAVQFFWVCVDYDSEFGLNLKCWLLGLK
jgi:hypothetical protein